MAEDRVVEDLEERLEKRGWGGSQVARALGPIAGPLLGVALVLLIFGAWKPDRFLSREAFENVVQSNYHIAVAAVGATFVIISGGIDLSVGSTMALASVCCAMALKGVEAPAYQPEQGIALGVAAGLLSMLCAVGRQLQEGRALWRATGVGAAAFFGVGLPVWLGWWLVAGSTIAPMSTPAAICVGVMAGGAVGLVNGVLVTSASLPPFVVTLATLGAVRGLTLYLTDGLTISSLPGGISELHFGEWWLGLPPNVWIALGVVAVGAVVLQFTVLGRYVYAIGSNERTARLCGVRVEGWKTLCYVIAGVTAGLAGVMMTAKFSTGQPTEFKGAELEVIAAVVIGGTSLFGGEGTVIGSFLGAMMLSILYRGCNIAGISTFVQQIFIGGTIVLAAALDRFRHLRR